MKLVSGHQLNCLTGPGYWLTEDGRFTISRPETAKTVTHTYGLASLTVQARARARWAIGVRPDSESRRSDRKLLATLGLLDAPAFTTRQAAFDALKLALGIKEEKSG